MHKKSIWILFYIFSIFLLGIGIVFFFILWPKLPIQPDINSLEYQSISSMENQNITTVKLNNNAIALVFAHKITHYLFDSDSWSQQGTQTYESLVSAWSAFVIDSHWYLLTSKHVVEDIWLDYTFILNGQSYSLDKRWFLDDKDIALVRIKDWFGEVPQNLSVLHLISEDKKSTLGQSVVVLGKAPSIDNIAVIFTKLRDLDMSLKSNNNWFYTWVFILDNELPSWFSWGPVLDMDFNVIWINTASSRYGFSYALSINQTIIQKFFKEH